MNKIFALVFHGEIAREHDPDLVRKKVQALLKLDAIKLERLFSGQKVYIKKGLDHDVARRYKQAFEATGAICSIEQEIPSDIVPTQPVQMVSCPKCGMEQQDALTCASCGIAMEKFRCQQQESEYGISPAAQIYTNTMSHASSAVSDSTGNGRLLTTIRFLIMITLVAVAGYFGYQQLMAGTEGNVVFTSNDCGEPCQLAISHLDEAGVEFIVYNVDASQENLNKFMKHRTSSLPLAVLNGKTLIGYNNVKYQTMIAEIRGDYLEESANKVVMYSAYGCGYCTRAQEFFAENKIDYIEHDIADPTSRVRYEALGGIGTPLILINGTRIDGFDKSAIITALRKADLM